MATLQAGSATADISPRDSQFLFGYPHVSRYSTGVHDALLTSALYLSDGQTQVMFIANDIIFVPKELARRVRERIEERTGIPSANIMITATHTHSGPKTVDYLSNEDDPTVPNTDPAYVSLFEDRILEVATAAHRRAGPAEVGLAVADGIGVGANRRNASGPADPEVPVLMVRSGGEPIACMVVYSMHPTVLHEDSTLISGDFPAMARRFLQRNLLGVACPVLYHTGPAGNQSPRHVVREHTFAEAERLGTMLGGAIARVIPSIEYVSEAAVEARCAFVDLPARTFPSVAKAKQRLDEAAARLAQLQASGAPAREIRTAEVDWFGAEETLTLAKASDEGRLAAAISACLPAEVQAIRVGPWWFVGWPGELFVEYALAVKARSPRTFVISLANGELQGYIATQEAEEMGGYEASNALFAPQSGKKLVNTTLKLLLA
jgi:neutral ceramidase